MDREVVANRFFELDGAAMRSTFDLALTEQAKPTFNQIEPRAGSGREVKMEARVARKPSLYRRRLVRAVIVHDQMDVQCRWHALIDGAQELQELAAAMAPMQLADDLAGGKIQRRKQGGRAVAHVIVTAPFCDAKAQRQQRLRAIERLDLRLLVHTQHRWAGTSTSPRYRGPCR